MSYALEFFEGKELERFSLQLRSLPPVWPF